jgi:hypothetical protein
MTTTQVTSTAPLRRLEEHVHTLANDFPNSFVVRHVDGSSGWLNETYIIHSGEDDNSLLVCFSFKLALRDQPVTITYNAVLACTQNNSVLTIKRAIGFFHSDRDFEDNQDEWFYGNDIVSPNETAHSFQKNGYNELHHKFPHHTVVSDCQHGHIEEITLYNVVDWISMRDESRMMASYTMLPLKQWRVFPTANTPFIASTTRLLPWMEAYNKTIHYYHSQQRYQYNPDLYGQTPAKTLQRKWRLVRLRMRLHKLAICIRAIRSRISCIYIASHVIMMAME